MYVMSGVCVCGVAHVCMLQEGVKGGGGGVVTESLASGFPRLRWSKTSLSLQLQRKQ